MDSRETINKFCKETLQRVLDALTARLNNLDRQSLTPTERADLDVKLFIERTLVAQCASKGRRRQASARAKDAFRRARKAISELENASERDYLLRTLVVAARNCGADPGRPENEVDDAIREIGGEDERQTALYERARAMTRQLEWRAAYTFLEARRRVRLISRGLDRRNDESQRQEYYALEESFATTLSAWYKPQLARIASVADELEYQIQYENVRVRLLALDRIVTSFLLKNFDADLRADGEEPPFETDEPESFEDRLYLYDGSLSSARPTCELAGNYMPDDFYQKAFAVLEEASEQLASGRDANGEKLDEDELEALRARAKKMALYSIVEIMDCDALRELYRALDAFDAINAQLLRFAQAMVFFNHDHPIISAIEPVVKHVVDRLSDDEEELDLQDPGLREVIPKEFQKWLAFAEELAAATKEPCDRARREAALCAWFYGFSCTNSLSKTDGLANVEFPPDYCDLARARRHRSEALKQIARVDSPLERLELYVKLLKYDARACQFDLRDEDVKLFRKEVRDLDSDMERAFAVKKHARSFFKVGKADQIYGLLDDEKQLAATYALIELNTVLASLRNVDADEDRALFMQKARELDQKALAGVRADEPTVEAERIIEFTRAITRRYGFFLRYDAA